MRQKCQELETLDKRLKLSFEQGKKYVAENKMLRDKLKDVQTGQSQEAQTLQQQLAEKVQRLAQLEADRTTFTTTIETMKKCMESVQNSTTQAEQSAGERIRSLETQLLELRNDNKKLQEKLAEEQKPPEVERRRLFSAVRRGNENYAPNSKHVKFSDMILPCEKISETPEQRYYLRSSEMTLGSPKSPSTSKDTHRKMH